MITESVLIWFGSLAALASVGMFVDMDPTTNLIIPWVAALLWGVQSLFASNVIISNDVDPPVTTSMETLSIVALVFAGCCAVFGLYQLVARPAAEATEGAANSEVFK
jgi:hypothetical protein